MPLVAGSTSTINTWLSYVSRIFLNFNWFTCANNKWREREYRRIFLFNLLQLVSILHVLFSSLDVRALLNSNDIVSCSLCDNRVNCIRQNENENTFCVFVFKRERDWTIGVQEWHRDVFVCSSGSRLTAFPFCKMKQLCTHNRISTKRWVCRGWELF